jgi:hypothetical protein
MKLQRKALQCMYKVLKTYTLARFEPTIFCSVGGGKWPLFTPRRQGTSHQVVVFDHRFFNHETGKARPKLGRLVTETLSATSANELAYVGRALPVPEQSFAPRSGLWTAVGSSSFKNVHQACCWKPKIPIWVHLWSPRNEKCWKI